MMDSSYILILIVIILGAVIWDKREKSRSEARKEAVASEAAAAKKEAREARYAEEKASRREEVCYGCRYWNADEFDLNNNPEMSGVEECRRFPPRIGSDGETTWPETSAFDWCGEWKERDAD